MNNEEIIRELAYKRFPENISYSTIIDQYKDYNLDSRSIFIEGALQIAAWKDEQYKIAYVVTRSEEHCDYVEKVFFDKEKAEEYCKHFNEDENSYYRDITEIEVIL